MRLRFRSNGSRGPGDPALVTVVAGVAALSLVRAVALFLTPLELYPDEAQYWLWSRHLAFGYYSKPPMVAWLIALTTAIGGDGEPWVRLSALVCHGLAALALFRAGERLYDARTGAGAALVYSLMPGVQLSSGVIATDAPLLLFLSLSLWAYAALWRAESPRARHVAAAGLGLALGLACLSKYAALYFVSALILHAAIDQRARTRWRPETLALAAGGVILLIAPNLVWNVTHGYSTVLHTWGEAGAKRRAGLLQAGGAVEFLIGQLGVFGPVPFLVLVGGVAAAVRRRTLEPEDRLLLCLTVPALVVILGEAVLARANANWAAAAYVAGSVLAAAWLVRRRARLTFLAILATQGVATLLFMAAAVQPSLAAVAGLSGSLKRAQGRRAETALITAEIARLSAREPLSAVAVDYRFDFNTLAYYGRATWARPGAPPLRMWVRYVGARNQAEAEAPLAPRDGRRVLFVNRVRDFAREARADFVRVEEERLATMRLDRRHARSFALFVGRNFSPRPRDPISGRPTPP